MHLWDKLFGTKKRTPYEKLSEQQTRLQASKGLSLEAEILAASREPIPDDWDLINGDNDALRFTLRFPLGWIDGTSQDRELGLGNVLIVRPPSARILRIDGKQAFSPSIVFASKQGGEFRDDALLDRWASMRGEQFQGFLLRESVKTTVHGVRALAMFHEFNAVNERWTCLLLLRVVGNAFVYADARGIEGDFVSLRQQLIRVLSCLEITAKPPSTTPRPAPPSSQPALRQAHSVAASGNNLTEEERKSIYSEFHTYLNTHAMIDAVSRGLGEKAGLEYALTKASEHIESSYSLSFEQWTAIFKEGQSKKWDK